MTGSSWFVRLAIYTASIAALSACVNGLGFEGASSEDAAVHAEPDASPDGGKGSHDSGLARPDSGAADAGGRGMAADGSVDAGRGGTTLDGGAGSDAPTNRDAAAGAGGAGTSGAGGSDGAMAGSHAEVALELTRDWLLFQGINGATLPSQTVTLRSGGASVEWTASTDVDWLVIDRTSGTSPGTLVVEAKPGIPALVSGEYHATITLHASHAGNQLTALIEVDLRIRPASLTLTPSELVLLDSDDSRAWTSKPVQLTLNTGEAAHAWTAMTNASWVQLDRSAGTVSAKPTTIMIDAADGTPEGAYTVTFQATINGEAVIATLPVRLKRHTHRVLVSDDGIALASMPGLSLLASTVVVRDNLGRDTRWTARSSQSWLAVTASGRAGDELVLTANPAQLTVDAIHYATVEVSADDADVEGPERIRVGLWIGSATPDPEARVDLAFSELISDPIRPYVYVHRRGTDIQIFNVHTASLVGTIPAVAAQLDSMAVSSDGSRLFAIDSTNYRMVPVDLDTRMPADPWPMVGVGALVYARVNGGRLLFSGRGEVRDIESGELLDATYGDPFYGAHWLTVSRDGSQLCTLNSGISPYTLECSALEYTEADGHLSLTPATGRLWGAGSNGQDVALGIDGSRVYVASGAPYQFDVFDAVTFQTLQTLPGNAYPNNIEVADDGRILGGTMSWYGPTDVWLYEPDGVLIDDWYLSGYAKALLPRQLKFSGDGLRAVALTDDPALVFVNAPLAAP